MKRKSGLWVAALMAVLLAGCGGGGGSGGEAEGSSGAGGLGAGSPGAGSPGGESSGGGMATLEGGYSTAATDGTSGRAVILEDGTVWNVGGVESDGVLLVHSMIQGTLDLDGSNNVTSNDLRVYDFDGGPTTMAAFSGSRMESGVVSGSVTATAGNPVSVTLMPVPSADFDYDTPATPSALAGIWTGFFSTGGDTGSVSISLDGSVSSVTDIGCSIDGSAEPRLSGKNVYDVSVTFGPAPCALPNGSATGIAVIVGSGADRQLTVGVTTADRSLGAAFFGSPSGAQQ